MADDTPSENPFENSNGDFPPTIDEGVDQMSQGTPHVAAKAGKKFILIGIIGVVVLFLLFSIFGDKKKTVKDEATKITVAPKPPEPPPLPVVEAPIVTAPPLITPAPIVPEPIKMTAINPIAQEDDSAAKARAQARMRSGLMLKDGGSGDGAGSLLSGSGSASASSAKDANSQFALGLPTKTERVEATNIGDLRRTIAQGRIIQATMESALNTDLPAPIRAIVSRDTYGEAGNTPLIPKGSRLIGTYNTSLTSGQTRVFVVWTRVIRPDGIDVQLGSPLVDAIGQAGVTGQVDTHFQEIFSRSLLSSVMNIATAIGADKLQGGGSSTTTTSTTGSQTSGDAATTATTNALNRLGSVTDGFIQKFINVPVTILIDQGTSVNVFVNKDLIFPADAAGVRIVN